MGAYPTWAARSWTAGGLIFVAAAMDDYLRAFDVDTGMVLWRGRLPAGGQATPTTYSADGRQYVVIAAGGHPKLGTRLGDYLVAFALRRSRWRNELNRFGSIRGRCVCFRRANRSC